MYVCMYVCMYVNYVSPDVKSLLVNCNCLHTSVLGMAMEQGGAEGWGLHPHPTWFYLAPSPPCPTPHDRENFLTPSPPLGALQSSVSHHKILLFVNLPYN